jgi:hypothetical protein
MMKSKKLRNLAMTKRRNNGSAIIYFVCSIIEITEAQIFYFLAKNYKH